MSESVLPPTAPTTLVLMLGASAWPNSPGFQASKAFMHAAHGFRDYLLDPRGFGLPAANLLDLFDAPSGASDQLEQLDSFLQQQSQALIATNQEARDVLVYFVGHGGFAGPSADFYLMHRRANASSLRASGLSIDALAEVLREKARQARRYLFLDCCFAAAAFRSFQGGPDQTAIKKTLDAFAVQARSSGFPGRGTALLSSSDQKSPSLLLPDESCTMFSYALLDVLRNGDLHRPLQLSLRDIKELVEDRLAELPEKNAPRPGLHSPDQSEGDVADVPFFPNPRAEEEQRLQAKEAKRHQAEEQARRIEEERVNAVVWSGSQIVAVGVGGGIFTSPDGSTWTTQHSGTSQILGSVAWSGSQFVTVGSGGAILTSPDGSTWTTQHSGTSQILEGVAWSGSQFVIVGFGGTILTSSDGSTWTTQHSGTSRILWGVVWSGSRFVAVGDQGTILTSPDGSTWTTQHSGTSRILYSVAWSGSQFVTVGDQGTILTSSDGSTWTTQHSATSQILEGVAWSGSQFVIVGSGGTILTSSDGSTWTTQHSGTSQNLWGVVWSGSRFVAVGDQGTILISP